MIKKLTYNNQIIVSLSAIAIGGLFFISILGTQIIKPTNIAWLMDGSDWPQHFLGWHFFKNEPWQFPPGKLISIQPPISTSIGYTDSIPIIALIFKLFANILPHNFQYIGFWLLLCFCLQGFFGALLVSTVSRDFMTQLIGAGIFVISPILLLRIGHPALCSHWILLAALWLYFRKRKDISHINHLAPWISIVFIGAAVHPTITVMILGLAFAYYLRLWLVDRAVKIRYCILNFSVLISLTLLVWWLIGYFELGQIGGSYGAYGVGDFSMNLLAPINPMAYGNWEGSWSTFLLSRPLTTDLQMDGFNYLGVGVIILALCVFYAAVTHPPEFETIMPILPLAFLCISFTLLALSYKITLGNHIIFEFKLNQEILKALSIFRASGRFFWPPYYSFLFLIITFIIRRNNAKIGLLMLAICLAFQLADFQNIYNSPLLKELRNTRREWQNPLKSEVWSVIGENYDKVIIVPPLFYGEEPAVSYIPFAYLAANYGMSTNSFYLARYNYVIHKEMTEKLISDIRSGVIDANAVYVLNKKYLRFLKSKAKMQAICSTIDGYNVCVSAREKSMNYFIDKIKDISASPGNLDTTPNL